MDAEMILKIERKPDEIVDRLFLGSLFDAERKEVLQKLGIKYILVTGRNLTMNYKRDFTYKRIDIADESNENIGKYFEDCSK